jgi:two-component system, chemotaxis family, CheB/CheR fusion protein
VDNGTLLGMSITFTDVSRYQRLQEEIHHSKQELETAYEELQSTNEELETTNEELQSTVEELETTNEELQSTNEELETMNEELQSTNEELQAVNTELRARTDELHEVNACLESILGCLHTAVIVVDQRLHIVSWNQQAEEFWGVRQEEVQGQPLANLDIGLPIKDVVRVVRTCVSDGADPQEIILPAMNRRGRQFTCRVTCTPLRNDQSTRLGAILLMEDRGEAPERPS